MNKKTIIIISIALTLAFILAGCNGQLNEGGEGTITVNLGGANPRVVLGQADIPKLSYEIILTNSKHTINETFPAGTEKASISAPLGTYVLTVRAVGPQGINGYTLFGAGDILLAVGEENVTVQSGSAAPVTVNMNPAAEVETWEQLMEAVGTQPYINGIKEEIIIIKKSFETISSSGGSIEIIRPITIIPEGDVTITGTGGNNGPFFSIGNTTPSAKLTMKTGLNGGSLTLDGNKLSGVIANNPFILVSDGVFELNKGVILQNNDFSAVQTWLGTFNMYGGEITNNTSNNTSAGGGGVYIELGAFNMYGGTISGNTSTTSGGGVYIEGSLSGGQQQIEFYKGIGAVITGNKTVNPTNNAPTSGQGSSIYISSDVYIDRDITGSEELSVTVNASGVIPELGNWAN